MKLLITGFDGFDGHDLNPSWEMLRPIPTSYGEHEIIKVRVDVTWEGGGYQVLEAMREHQPDAVLSFGFSGGNNYFRHESLGANVGGNYPDNNGVVLDNLIDTSPTAPIGAPSTVSASTAVSWSSDCPVPPAQESTNAGDYLCNQAAYLVGCAVAPGGEFAGKKFIFTHVPADSLDWRYSGYYKLSIGAMADITAAMIRGMFRDYLGVPEITDWGPVATGPDLGPHIAEPPRANYFDPLNGRYVRAVASYTDGVHGVPQRSDFYFSAREHPPHYDWEGWDSSRRYFSTRNKGMKVKVTRESDGVDVTAEKFGSDSPSVVTFTYSTRDPDKLMVGVINDNGSTADLRSGGPYIITVSGLDLMGEPFEVNMRLSYPESGAGTYELIT